ncbi:unnamed protein product [Prorocentrum cordatum]|uniref:Uncharacterized protein n=1 Tax=Prorocentrum cordatum TaxID=2364126 RepID=A0ABN9XPH4_9DINO|nr:unnamed protein product [Polarella glacialis]
MAPHAPRAAVGGALAVQLLGVAVHTRAPCSHASWGWSATASPGPSPPDSGYCQLFPHMCDSPASTPEPTSDLTPAPTRAPTVASEPTVGPTPVPTGDPMTTTVADDAVTSQPEVQVNTARDVAVCVAVVTVSVLLAASCD